MGLSSSQGRLLMLTSRLSDIELNEVLISQKKSQLAQQSEKAAKDYQESISNYTIKVHVPDLTGEEAKGYTNEEISFSALAQAGYLVHNSSGDIYMFNKIKDAEGNESFAPIVDASGNALTTTPERSAEDPEQWEVSLPNENRKRRVIDATKYLKDSKTLQNSIINGSLYLYNVADQQGGISANSINTETKLEYVLDTADDAMAESKYQYEVARISRQDNMLDLEMQQLETQHEAVLKEYDSIKKVISNNVDRTFKIFSDG